MWFADLYSVKHCEFQQGFGRWSRCVSLTVSVILVLNKGLVCSLDLFSLRYVWKYFYALF